MSTVVARTTQTTAHGLAPTARHELNADASGPADSLTASADWVILLHGLGRTSWSLAPVKRMLKQQGYRIINVDYPSRSDDIETLARNAIEPALAKIRERPHGRIHFVTHSMGGILLRAYLASNSIDRLGRVVMLGPPNRGSEIIDRLRDVPGFSTLIGPAGLELGTGRESTPNLIGAAAFDVGVIAGNRSDDVILSKWLPGPNDGKVSVASARLDGMADFAEVPFGHTFIMARARVLELIADYLKNGKFAAQA